MQSVDIVQGSFGGVWAPWSNRNQFLVGTAIPWGMTDTKGHPESRLAKLSSSDTETAEEMNSSDKRHPQLDTYLKYFNVKHEAT